MGLQSLASSESLAVPVAIAAVAILTSVILYVFSKPALPANAPKLTDDAWPLIGSRNFFTKRYDFYRDSMAKSSTGAFSFWAGKWPVIAIAGNASRKMFFDTKLLNLQDGYAALLSGAPEVKENVLADKYGVDAGEYESVTCSTGNLLISS